MEKLTFLLNVLILGFLSACAQMSPVGSIPDNEFYSDNLRVIDPSNHNAVAKHFEDAANEMKAKLEAQKKLLQEYEEHGYYYGPQGQDLKSHSSANIRQYEKSIKENMKQAAIHRKMALDEEKSNLGFINKSLVRSELN